jgi:hypothetical protein
MASAHQKSISELETPIQHNSGYHHYLMMMTMMMTDGGMVLPWTLDRVCQKKGRRRLEVKSALYPMERINSIYNPHMHEGEFDLCLSTAKIHKST